MQQKILWGERVPGAPYPFPIEELMRIPDDSFSYEVVEGELIRMPSSGFHASKIAARLLITLGSYVDAHDLGDVTGADGSYDLTRPGDAAETVLVPDLAFVQAGRITTITPGFAKLAPDLAVEIVSPSQYRPEMAAKAQFYLDRGVRLIWIVWPHRQEVDVWRPSSSQAPTATLSLADSLDGYDVIPGFTYPLATLFK